MRILAEHPPEGWDAELLASHVAGSPWAKWRAYRRARSTLIGMLKDPKRKPDVVHLHTAADWSWWRKRRFAYLAHGAGSKVVVHIHSGQFDVWLGGRSSPQSKRFTQAVNDIDATVVVLSEAWAKKLQPLIGQTRAISNPVDPRMTPGSAPRDRDHLLLLGRDDPVKNHAMAVDIALKLRDKRPGLKLTMTGIQQSTHPFIKALGWVSEEKKLHLLQTASALLLPSLYEGQPMVALEAHACGMPIIASGHLSSLPPLTINAGPTVEDWVSILDAVLEQPSELQTNDAVPQILEVQQQWSACYSPL